MSIIDSVKDKVVEWLWGKAFKKTIARGVTLLVSWIIGLNLSQYGLDINPELLTAAVYLGLDNVRSFIKLKFPSIGKWL